MTERLSALDGVRAYAALLIFCVHFFGMYAAVAFGVNTDTASWQDLNGWALQVTYFLAHSHYGVDLFFILSGYLIANLLAQKSIPLHVFLWRRVLRIYPAFLLSLLAAAWVGIHWFQLETTVPGWLANLFFLNGLFDLNVRGYNPVTWSLFFEFCFYALAVVLALGYPRALEKPLPALLFGIVISSLLMAFWPTQNAMFFGYFSLFFCGVWLRTIRATEVATYLRKIPGTLTIALWLLFVIAHGTHFLHNRMVSYFIAFAIAGTLLIGAAIYRDDSLVSRVFMHKTLARIGRISYSFYLVHYVVIHLTFHLLRERMSSLHAIAQFAIYAATTLTLSLCAAMLLYRVTEHYYFSRTNR